MDLNNYKGTGSGLSYMALSKLFEILEKLGDDINILEFGSGQSTRFLVDYKLYSKKNITIDSYDNDTNYAYNNKDNHKFLNLRIKPLISCSDENFDEQIKSKIYNRDYFTIHKLPPYNDPKFWRQRNCFYDLDPNDLKPNYDLVIIDGPNGNGRNIAYLHIKNVIKKSSIVFIDDANCCDGDYNYNFITNLNYIIDVKNLYENKKENIAIFEVL